MCQIVLHFGYRAPDIHFYPKMHFLQPQKSKSLTSITAFWKEADQRFNFAS